VNIDNKFIPKQRIIAEHFIENPDNYRDIKFKNKNKFDYRIDNLEWQSSGAKTNSKAQYLTELPKTAIQITSFRKCEFKDYYYDKESKQVIQVGATKSGDKIKIIKPSVSNKRNIIVIKDIEGRRRTVDYDSLISKLNDEEQICLWSDSE
jgi:hypothetical protein